MRIQTQEQKDKLNEYKRNWSKDKPELRFMRYFRHRLKSRYGMTPEQFYELANAFHGKCFICQREMILPDKVKRPVRHGRCAVVDHDHAINQVRGVICNNCNRALGFLNTSSTLHRAMVYLDTFNKVAYGAS